MSATPPPETETFDAADGGRPPSPVGLDVPVRPVAARRPGRGVGLALVAIVAVVAVGGGGALLANGSGPAPASASAIAAAPSSPPAVPPPTPSPALGPTLGPGPTTDPNPEPQVLPSLRDSPLPGAPLPQFSRRDGDDLERWVWRAGQPLALAGTFPGAYAGFVETDPSVTTIGPSGVAVIRELGSLSEAGTTDRLRIVVDDGSVVLDRDDVVGSPFAPIWSAAGDRAVVAGPAGTWLVLEIQDRRLVADLEVPATLPPEAGGPSPAPGAPSGGPGTLGLPIPVAFSQDGAWLYIGRVDPLSDARPTPAARISTADGSVELIDAFPTTGLVALAPAPGALPEVDPASGRRLDPFVPYRGRPIDLRVREPDGQQAFSYHFDALAGAAWTGTGSLLVLQGDAFPGPSYTALAELDSTGRLGPPIVETGPLQAAQLIGVRQGHALVIYVVGEPFVAKFVLVRLADLAMATLEVAEADVGGMQLAGWADP